MNKQQPFQESKNRTTMPTTTVTIRLNMGYMDGTQENTMTIGHAQANQEILTQHVQHCLPEPDDLDLADVVQQIKFVSLEFGEWRLDDETVWANACMDPSEFVNYTMQLIVAICHEQPVAFDAVQAIVDAIYNNGAMFPCTLTLDEDSEISHTFLYPYHSAFVSLDHRICMGDEDEDEDEDDISEGEHTSSRLATSRWNASLCEDTHWQNHHTRS